MKGGRKGEGGSRRSALPMQNSVHVHGWTLMFSLIRHAFRTHVQYGCKKIVSNWKGMVITCCQLSKMWYSAVYALCIYPTLLAIENIHVLLYQSLLKMCVGDAHFEQRTQALHTLKGGTGHIYLICEQHKMCKCTCVCVRSCVCLCISLWLPSKTAHHRNRAPGRDVTEVISKTLPTSLYPEAPEKESVSWAKTLSVLAIVAVHPL